MRISAHACTPADYLLALAGRGAVGAVKAAPDVPGDLGAGERVTGIFHRHGRGEHHAVHLPVWRYQRTARVPRLDERADGVDVADNIGPGIDVGTVGQF